MTEQLSVTEVRNALRCPRIFALGRKNSRAVAFPVGSSCLGSAFHRIVDRFASEVSSPPEYFRSSGAPCPRDEVESKLVRWLIDLLVDELDRDPSYAAIPGEVDDLAEALREFARHLSGRVDAFRISPSEGLQRAVRGGEREISAPLGAKRALLRGRLDALFGSSQGELEVIEYKLTDEANDLVDRVQVALYRQLLLASEQVAARPVVLRFSPSLRETAIAAEDADRLYQQTLLPLIDNMVSWANDAQAAPATERKDLCVACPVARECADFYPQRLSVRDDPPMAGTRPRPAQEGNMQEPSAVSAGSSGHDDEDGRREAETIRDNIIKELKRQGVLAASPRPPIVGPTLYMVEIAKPRGSVAQLDKAAVDVAHRLAVEHGIELEYQKHGGRRHFIAKRPKPRRVLLLPLLEQRKDWLSARPGRFIVGQAPTGEIVTGDFADSSTPHLLVAGQAGSGKSVLLQAIVASLVQFHGPERLRFTLVDPKRVTFITPSFKSAVLAHLDGPIRFEAEETLPVIEQLIEIMEERYALFARAQVVDLDEYNGQVAAHERLERRLLVVDEYQDLVVEKAVAAAFNAGVARLGAKARAAGIHLLLATQRPDKSTVPPIIKANLGGKIALQVASQVNSRIILDQAGAEKLMGRGDLLADLGHGVVRAQGPMLG